MRALIIGAVVVVVLVVGYLVFQQKSMTPQEEVIPQLQASEQQRIEYMEKRRAATEKTMQEQAAKNPAPEMAQ